MTKYKTIYDNSDIQMIEQSPLYEGFLTIKKYSFRHRCFDKTMSNIVHREVVERGDAVILLAYDPKRDEVVMIEQIRIAMFSKAESSWALELIAGMIDRDESPEEVARREAMEEAGIEIGRCEPVLSYFPSPGGSTEKLYIFAGETDATKAGGVYGLKEEDEDILVHVMPRQQAYQLIEDGQIINAGTLIALQWLELNYQKLQQKWR